MKINEKNEIKRIIKRKRVVVDKKMQGDYRSEIGEEEYSRVIDKKGPQ